MLRRLSVSGFLLISGMLLAVGAGLAAEAKAAAPPPYAPGLGDFMTAYVQPHHIKLWLAGSAGDWKLAAYEASELGETFDDVATYQATWNNVPVARLVKAIIEPALKKVEASIASKNMVQFKTDYGTLTNACNSCHMTAQHEFLEIRVPAANPYPDQNFTPH